MTYLVDAMRWNVRDACEALEIFEKPLFPIEVLLLRTKKDAAWGVVSREMSDLQAHRHTERYCEDVEPREGCKSK